MKFSHNFVMNVLSDCEVQLFLPKEKSFLFQEIRFIAPDMETFSENVLYIGTSGQIDQLEPSQLAGILLVSLGTPADLESLVGEYHAGVITLPGDCHPATIGNRLYSTLERLQRWSARLETAILSKQDYQTLLALAGEIFGSNPVIMVNSSYNLLACSINATPHNEKIDWILRNGYYPKDVTDGLAKMGYQTNGVQYTTPLLLMPPNYMNCPLMVLSSHSAGGIFLGFLTVYFVENQPTATHFELFSHLALAVRSYYLENIQEDPSTPTPLETFMEDLINHTREDETYLQDRARSLRLPLEATYRLCVIHWDNFVLSQATYVMGRLRTCLKFPFFKVLLYHQSILLLLHGDISSLKVMDEINESFGEFRELLKICQGFAGFSTASFPLLKMNIAYQQAISAVKYGARLAPEQGIYFYSHFYIYEMLDDYSRRYPLEDMYVQKLRLLENPAEERYDNLELLRNYLLTECSISTTAKLMHMHRNSVIYRLGKIQELLGLDLNDPDVRLRLQISFKMLELLAGRIQPIRALPAQENEIITFYE